MLTTNYAYFEVSCTYTLCYIAFLIFNDIIKKIFDEVTFLKTVLITGASNGIGAATATLFAKKGYSVIINFNNSESAAFALQKKLAADGCVAIALKADVSDRTETETMFDKIMQQFGHIDVLVNNAGIDQQKLFTDITPDDWNKMISVNLTGAFNCSQLALRSMLKNHSGSIVNVASMWGETGASLEVHYSVAKAGLIGLTKALAKEVGPSGIRVNCVSPGVIDTKMNSAFSPDDISVLINNTPLGKIGTPTDVANAIYFFSSVESQFITGQVLGVNGGFLI